jgi:hypothetical protein
MSSPQQPLYWDTVRQTLAAGTDYKVNLPSGTIDWTVVNTSASTISIAGTAATIASPHLAVVTLESASGKGQELYLANATGGGLTIVVSWIRPGRQPTADAGVTTFTAL